MIRRPADGSISEAAAAFQPSVTLQALRKFQKPSQLWRGYTALAARNLPFTAMQFPVFEHLQERIKQYRRDNGTFTGTLTETGLVTAVSAGSAGSVAAIITTPIDVVKTRIMLAASGEGSEVKAKKEVKQAQQKCQSLNELANRKGVTRKSGFTVVREVITKSGVKGLFRGGTLRAAWTALGSGLYLGVYESGRVWLGDQHEASEDIS
jgi:solute carrier family 25 S-adenosylmethionine transporter 26